MSIIVRFEADKWIGAEGMFYNYLILKELENWKNKISTYILSQKND